MSSYNHKSLKNKRCGSSRCDNPARKRILFSLGFSASFCEKCADELIRNNLGVEEGQIILEENEYDERAA
jgi:hypothetical protein